MKKILSLLLTALTAMSALAQMPAVKPLAPAAKTMTPAAKPTTPAAKPLAPAPTAVPAATSHSFYTADSFLLRSNGPRISLYSFCPAYGDPGRAVYFRKDHDSAYHRATLHNLDIALADNPASMQQLRIAHTNVYLGVGLAVAGIGLFAAGLISTIHKNNEAQNAYSQASAQWYAQSQAHPFSNIPMPAQPHYSASPLLYAGPVLALSCIVPLFNVASHAQKAFDIYNQ